MNASTYQPGQIALVQSRAQPPAGPRPSTCSADQVQDQVGNRTIQW